MPLLSSLGLKISAKAEPPVQSLSWAIPNGLGQSGYASLADDTDEHSYFVSYGRVARLDEYGNPVWTKSYSGIPNMYNMVMDDSKLYCIGSSGGSNLSGPANILILNKSDGSVVYAAELSGGTYSLYGYQAISIDINTNKLFIGGMINGFQYNNNQADQGVPAIVKLDISSNTPTVESAKAITSPFSSVDFGEDYHTSDIAYNSGNNHLYTAARGENDGAIIFFAINTSTMNVDHAVKMEPQGGKKFYSPFVKINEVLPSVISFSFIEYNLSNNNWRQVWGAFNDQLDEAFGSGVIYPRYIKSLYSDSNAPGFADTFQSIAMDGQGYPISFHSRKYMVKTQPSTGNYVGSSFASFGTNPSEIRLFKVSSSPGGIITGNGDEIIKISDYDSSTVGYLDNNPSFGTFYEKAGSGFSFNDYSDEMVYDDLVGVRNRDYTQQLTAISVSASNFSFTPEKWTIESV